MRIVIGSDWAGHEVRDHLIEALTARGHEVTNVGTTEKERTGHPLVAREATRVFLSGGYDFGILICASGTGITIAANKVKGVRCALLGNFYSAKIAKELNKANFIAFGGATIHPLDAEKLTEAYMAHQYRGDEEWVAEWDRQIDDIEAGR
jgi:RpiB/LacA/LacB family sugar-phosphate isomerase